MTPVAQSARLMMDGEVVRTGDHRRTAVADSECINQRLNDGMTS